MTFLDGYSQVGFTCFRQDLKLVLTAVRRQLDSWGLRVLEREAEVDVTVIYSIAPRPGGRHPKKAVFFAPKTHPSSTVMFADYADGWQSLAVCVSRVLSGQVFRFALGSEREEWPLYLFEILESGKETRHVSVLRDLDRWKFWHTGEPLAMEDEAVYKKRQAKDRLTRDYLISLAEQLGFPVADDRFWQSDSKGVYFEEQRAEH